MAPSVLITTINLFTYNKMKTKHSTTVNEASFFNLGYPAFDSCHLED